MKKGPGQPPKGNVRLVVHIPPELNDQLRAEAKTCGLTISELTSNLLMSGLLKRKVYRDRIKT